jgi:hypothetical protein
MEFPDDVLTIIRAYSKPCMKFVNEYSAGLRKIRNAFPTGFRDNLNHDVKQKLYTEEATKLIDAWVIYTDSFEYIYKIPHNGKFLDPEYTKEMRRRKEIFRIRKNELRVLVYGKKR